jgi:hypothetical protein
MKTSDGSFQYCYNGQVIADERSQVVLAYRVGQSGADCRALPGMLTELDASLAAPGITARPRTLLADAGYFSAGNVEAVTAAGIDPLIATGRLKHGDSPASAPQGRTPAGLTPKQLMARKLRTKQGKASYARRKAIVEPVFGQLEVAQTGDRLRLRGKTNAEHEYGSPEPRVRDLAGLRGFADPPDQRPIPRALRRRDLHPQRTRPRCRTRMDRPNARQPGTRQPARQPPRGGHHEHLRHQEGIPNAVRPQARRLPHRRGS